MNRVQKIVCVSLFVMVACGPKPVSDQDLATAVEAKLYNNDATRAANVKVAVANGVVTLSGDMPSSDVALAAMTVANGTPGIKSVNNQMKVADSAAVSPMPSISSTPPPPQPTPPVVPAINPAAVADSRPQQHEEMSRHNTEPVAPEAPRKPITITIPVGTQVSVQMIDGIDTAHDQAGQGFHASLSAPITDDDRVIVPAGAPATVLLVESKSAGHIRGQSELELQLTEITFHGQKLHVSSSVFEEKGSSRGKQSAVRTGLGAAAGALIGGLAGGGRGAGIGAAAGGGAGVGVQLLTHGQQIKVPSETKLTFSLEAPLVLTR
jgi:hypothetical protein